MIRTIRLLALPLVGGLGLYAQTAASPQTFQGTLIDASCAQISRTTSSNMNHSANSTTRTTAKDDLTGQNIDQTTRTEEQRSRNTNSSPTGMTSSSTETNKRETATGSADRATTPPQGDDQMPPAYQRERQVRESTTTSSSQQTNTSVVTPGDGKHMDKSCMVTSTTSQFALRTDDGRTIPISADSNLRIPQMLSSDSRWTKYTRAGKEKKMHVTVSGSMDGDSLRVDSVRF